MVTLTRGEIEVLLDGPDRADYVVSAFADLTVQNGFERHVELHLKNQARAAGDALAEARARKGLGENLEVVRGAVRSADPKARGLAVFSCAAKGFRQVVPLDFPVENRLVIDEDPFVLPILEHWYADPRYLAALVDSDEAHLFEVRHGRPDRVRDVVRTDQDEPIQRDKPRFSFKKRFAQTRHERLFGAEDDRFLKSVAEAVRDHWQGHDFAGLVLLGQPSITGPLRRLLPREVAEAVVAEAPHAMADGLSDEVLPLLDRAWADREAATLAEFRERCKEKHRVALGATEVLDALQQGRAAEVLLSGNADIPGARCVDCDYRLGAPVRACPYCNGATRTVNAVQEILVMAMRHRVPVHVVRRPSTKDDPLAPANGVAALLHAEANWAPDH
jgi:protein required for attachment to host cells